jgi:hypothetical protein
MFQFLVAADWGVLLRNLGEWPDGLLVPRYGMKCRQLETISQINELNSGAAVSGRLEWVDWLQIFV